MNKLQKDHKKDISRSRKRAYLRELTINKKKQVKNLVRKHTSRVSISAEATSEAVTSGLATVSS